MGREYLGCVLYESSTDGAECRRKVVSRRRVLGAIGCLVNARGPQLKCSSALQEALLVAVLLYGS